MTKDELVTAFAERMIDQMDTGSLCELAMSYLTQTYSTYSEEELRAEVKEWAEDLLEDDDE